MQTRKISKENSDNYSWGDNCVSWVLSNSKNLSIKEERMPPRTKEQLHFHSDKEQFFYILKGCAQFKVANHIVKVTSAEGLHVLPKEPHFIENIGDSELTFLVISSPNVEDRKDL